MRRIVYGSIGVCFVVLFLIWSCKFGYQIAENPVSSWLAIAAILVSVATIASISFAVITYLEANVLKERVRSARTELLNTQETFTRRMADLQKSYYNLSRAVFKGLTEAFMSLKDVDEFKACMRYLRDAEIDIHLIHSSVGSLKEAIQTAFKFSKRRFLEMESEIWDKTQEMEAKESEEVRYYYLTLKDLIIQKLP